QFCGKSHADDPLPANIFTGLRTQGDIAQLGRTLNRNGEPVGRVCSTAWSPYLRCGVAIARMDDPADGPGTQLGVESHDGTMLRGELCTLPMYDPERLIPRGRLVDIPDRHD
ncbi:MAG: aminomethyl transferase family protein, partial [Acidimicrobiales bacterium]|nr:aminomethyl transferase family protein [Acidimicrobiales bacterium]